MVARIIDNDDELKKNHDVPNISRYRFSSFNTPKTRLKPLAPALLESKEKDCHLKKQQNSLTICQRFSISRLLFSC